MLSDARPLLEALDEKAYVFASQGGDDVDELDDDPSNAIVRPSRGFPIARPVQSALPRPTTPTTPTPTPPPLRRCGRCWTMSLFVAANPLDDAFQISSPDAPTAPYLPTPCHDFIVR